MKKCVNEKCENLTDNPKFCCRSCAASFNNKKFVKRIRTRKCRKNGCTERTKNYQTTLCDFHKSESDAYLGDNLKRLTIKEYNDRKNLDRQYHTNKYTGIRELCRTWLRDLRNLSCKNCGYEKHVELCHIKPIKDFPLTATLGEINSRENVVQLCPNCHWEFDKGLLKLSNNSN